MDKRQDKQQDKRQRINIDIEKILWREVSIMAARLGVDKRGFVVAALQEKIEREQKERK